MFNSDCITDYVMRNSKDDNDGAARSLFLAGLMIGSVLVGGLFYDFESEGINLAPIIESDVPDSILIGSVDILYVSVNDEDMSSLKIHDSGVYVTGNPDNTIKAGYTRNLMSRITHFRDSNTLDSIFYLVIPTRKENAYQTEQFLLQLLSPSRRYPVAADLRQDQKEVFKMTDQIMHLIIHFLNTTCFEPFKVYKNIGDNPLAA